MSTQDTTKRDIVIDGMPLNLFETEGEFHLQLPVNNYYMDYQNRKWNNVL